MGSTIRWWMDTVYLLTVTVGESAEEGGATFVVRGWLPDGEDPESDCKYGKPETLASGLTAEEAVERAAEELRDRALHVTDELVALPGIGERTAERLQLKHRITAGDQVVPDGSRRGARPAV